MNKIKDFIKNLDLANVDAGTWTRTIVLLLTFVNLFIQAAGGEEIVFDEDNIAMIVSSGLAFAAALAGFWKNNSFSKDSQEYDRQKRIGRLNKQIKNLKNKNN